MVGDRWYISLLLCERLVPGFLSMGAIATGDTDCISYFTVHASTQLASIAPEATGDVMVPAVLHVEKLLTLLASCTCTSQLSLQGKLTQSTVSYVSFCWPSALSALHLLLPLVAELTLAILSPSHLTEEKQRLFVSVLGWLLCVVNICACGTVFLFDFVTCFEEFCCSVFCFLKSRQISPFRNLCFLLSLLTSYSIPLETVKGYIPKCHTFTKSKCVSGDKACKLNSEKVVFFLLFIIFHYSYYAMIVMATCADREEFPKIVWSTEAGIRHSLPTVLCHVMYVMKVVIKLSPSKKKFWNVSNDTIGHEVKNTFSFFTLLAPYILFDYINLIPTNLHSEQQIQVCTSNNRSTKQNFNCNLILS
jgi:hypothetical protein